MFFERPSINPHLSLAISRTRLDSVLERSDEGHVVKDHVIRIQKCADLGVANDDVGQEETTSWD